MSSNKLSQKMEKVIHFYTRGLKKPLTKKEMKSLRLQLSLLRPKRKQVTPLVVGYLLAIRSEDRWLRRTSRGAFGVGSSKSSVQKTHKTSTSPKPPKGGVRPIRASATSGVVQPKPGQLSVDDRISELEEPYLGNEPRDRKVLSGSVAVKFISDVLTDPGKGWVQFIKMNRLSPLARPLVILKSSGPPEVIITSSGVVHLVFFVVSDREGELRRSLEQGYTEVSASVMRFK
jgi:hypothetical protein